MSPTTTTTVEHFAMDGPFGLSMAVLLGVALSLVLAWILRREAQVLGRTTVVLFWALRTVAVGVVLWMLLAPMNVVVETSTTRRAILFATDVSGSMQTVDPAGTSDDLRWAMARSMTEQPTATQTVDEAVAAIGLARHHLQLARVALQQHRQDGPVVEAITAANTAIQGVQAHLQRVDEGALAANLSDRSRTLVDRLLQQLAGTEFQTLAQLTAALGKNRTPSQKGWRESLPDLEHRVTGLKTALQELARAVSDEESQQVRRDHPELLSTVQQENRRDRAAKFVAALQAGALSPLQDRADIRFGDFDQTLHGFSPQNSSRSATATAVAGTDLAAVFEALHRERQQQPLAAVFLLSDVAHNQPGDKNPRDIAATLSDTPVYVVPIGNTQHVRDVRLRSVFAPSVAMRNDDIVIEASLQAFDCEGEVCVVRLQQNGETLDQQEVVLDSGFASRTVRFERHVPTLGTERYRVAIEPIEGELSEDNNAREFEVNVTRSDIKILLADEFPRWEYRYLTQLFRRDANVECDELLFRPRMIATGRREATRTFPVTVEDWDQYDVVLLGDVPAEHLSVAAQESLIEYLQQRGGTLVMIAGPEAMPQAYVHQPLGEVLPVVAVEGTSPVDASGYEFRITKEGRDHQALMIGETEDENRVAWDLVNRHSTLPAVSAWRRPRATARTLIAAVGRSSTDPASEETQSAFLCWQPVGRGRIVYLSAPDSYRLRFLRGDRLHYRFWGQLLRWAIASDLAVGTEFVRVRTDKSRYEAREAVQITVRLANAEGEPVLAEDVAARIIQGDDVRTIPLTADPQIPGDYRGDVRSLSPGDYRIEPTGNSVETLQRDNSQEPASATLTVQNEMSTELLETRCDRVLAQQIADITGGQVLPPTAVREILELTNLEPIVSETVEQRPLWVQWKYLWLVFGCLQIEWIIRKWQGLS